MLGAGDANLTLLTVTDNWASVLSRGRLLKQPQSLGVSQAEVSGWRQCGILPTGIRLG